MSSALKSLRAKIKKRLAPNNGLGAAINSDGSIFTNPIAILLITMIAIGFILYGVYLYRNVEGKIRHGYTYYGQDIRTWTPLFTMNSEKIEPCIERCSMDPGCSGVTLDSDALVCTGTKHPGVLRQDVQKYSSWLKPQLATKNRPGPIKYRVAGLVLGKQRLTELPGLSSSGGIFNISTWLLLTDFYEGLGKWRHILHLGTDSDLISATLRTQSSQEWSNITAQLPDQLPGVWITPQNNNLRIAMTTIQRPEPSQVSKRVEWMDIGNVPLPGRQTHISINVYNEIIEVFIDGSLMQTMKLKGRPIIMQQEQPTLFLRQLPSTRSINGFAGRISDLLVIPRVLSPGEIKELTLKTKPT